MADQPIQRSFQQRQSGWWLGMISRPTTNPLLMTGPAYVAGTKRKPRPGDPVYYDATNKGFAVADDATNRTQVVGIVVSQAGEITKATTTGGSISFHTEYENNDLMNILLCGFVVGKADVGTTLSYGDRLVWDTTNNAWDKLADGPATITAAAAGDWVAHSTADEIATGMNLVLAKIKTYVDDHLARFHPYAAWCASPSATAGTLFEVGFGIGRVI